MPLADCLLLWSGLCDVLRSDDNTHASNWCRLLFNLAAPHSAYTRVDEPQLAGHHTTLLDARGCTGTAQVIHLVSTNPTCSKCWIATALLVRMDVRPTTGCTGNHWAICCSRSYTHRCSCCAREGSFPKRCSGAQSLCSLLLPESLTSLKIFASHN